MTSLVTDLTFDVIAGSAVTVIEVTVVIVLIVLLIERELLRAFEGRTWEFQARTLDNAIVPLVVTFVLLVACRLLELA
jgi:hypothetical protein